MSDAPLTDSKWKEEWAAHQLSQGRSSPAHGMCEFAADLERRIGKAQAAIDHSLATLPYNKATIYVSNVRAVLETVGKILKGTE